MAVELLDYDSADYFSDERSQRALLEDAFDSNDPGTILHAIGIVARARGMTALAHETGLKRQQLYHAFRSGGNPTIGTVYKVLQSLGLRLQLESAGA